MIVVATADFEVYHGAVNELRERGVQFTTIEPGDDLPDGTQVLLAAPDDDPVLGDDRIIDPASGSEPESGSGSESDDNSRSGDEASDADAAGIEVVVADPAEPRRAVDEALAAMRDAGGRTVIGVDPGERPGIAVRTGDVVTAAFQVPLADAAAVIEREAREAVDPVVRIGDGARLRGASIIDDLADLTIELVDETGTTPYLGTGARGMGDVLAAANIARLPGERINERTIEPTPGEIETIKRRSREQSDGSRTIDERLARRVAHGELTIDEALDEHRDR